VAEAHSHFSTHVSNLASLEGLVESTRTAALNHREHTAALRTRLDSSFSTFDSAFRSTADAFATAQHELEQDATTVLHDLIALEAQISAHHVSLDDLFNHCHADIATWKGHLHELQQTTEQQIVAASHNSQKLSESSASLRAQLRQSEEQFAHSLEGVRHSIQRRVQQLAHDSRQLEDEFNNLQQSIHDGAHRSVDRLQQGEGHVGDVLSLIAQQTADQHDSTMAALQSHLGERINEPVASSAGQLFAQFTGLGQQAPEMIGMLTNQTQGVVDTMSEIVRLIEAIKPVLELIRDL
jgi:hypothetical protein